MFIPISQKVNELLEKEKSNARKVTIIHPVTINIIKIFNSAIEAARITNINQSHISSVCSGKTQICR